MRVTMQILGVPNGTPYVLKGTSPEAALNFSQPGQVGLNSQNMGYTDVTGQSPLGQSLRTINQSITWTLTLNPGTAKQVVIPLGQSGPHKIYLTLGPTINDNQAHPYNLATDQRTGIAQAWVQKAIAETGQASPSPLKIIVQLGKDIYSKVGFNPNYDLWSSPAFGNYWLAPMPSLMRKCLTPRTLSGSIASRWAPLPVGSVT